MEYFEDQADFLKYEYVISIDVEGIAGIFSAISYQQHGTPHNSDGLYEVIGSGRSGSDYFVHKLTIDYGNINLKTAFNGVPTYTVISGIGLEGETTAQFSR